MEQKTTFKATLANAARWVVFLPAALAGALLAMFVSVKLNQISFGAMGITSGDYFRIVSAGVVTGSAFVYIGTLVAPGGRRFIPWLLAALCVLYLGMGILPLYHAGRWLDLLTSVTLAVAGFATAWLLTHDWSATHEEMPIRDGNASAMGDPRG